MEGARVYTSYLGSIPTGVAGVRATLKLMRDIVRQTRHTLPVQTKAGALVQGCAEKDYLCEASTLHAFVRDQIRYLRDTREVEVIRFPQQTMQLQYGDCDDKALLLAALAEGIGFNARFRAVGLDGEPYSHVYTELMIPGKGWTPAETIPIDDEGTKAALGWSPPNITSFMLAHI